MATMNPQRYVLVTGGSGGIGSALCSALAKIDIKPIIGYSTNIDKAKDLADDFGGISVHLDMNSVESLDKGVTSIVSALGVNGSLAGVVLGASPPPDLIPFSSLEPYHFHNQFQINVVGHHFLLARLIKNVLRKNKSGTVVGISSAAVGIKGENPATGMGAYVVGKAALNSLLSVCSAEFTWLKTVVVSPTFTKTPMLDVFDSRYLELIAQQQEISSPEDVAELISKEFIDE